MQQNFKTLQTIMTAAERIREIIHSRGLNVKTFAELCGYERPQVFYDIIKGKTRNISAAMCEHIIDALPDINRVWLLTGEGGMYTDQETPTPREDIAKVPLLPISAIAGPLRAYYEDGVNLSQCQWINAPTPLAEFAIPVTGDSMEPIFADGSIIFVKRINEEAFIPWGHPLVLDTENGLFIKNVMPDERNDYYIWAESVNPKYPRMHVPKSSIGGMYRVLSVTKSFATM